MNPSASTHPPGIPGGPALFGVNEAGAVAVTGLPRPDRAGYDDAPGPPFLGPSGNARGWPHRSFLELGALRGAVPFARLHARRVTWEWGLAALGEDIELLVSELVTNAVRASGAPGNATPVRLWLLSDGARVLIMVWDARDQPPVRVDADQDAESGRGLLLVEAISRRWSWYATPEPGGKVVWALSAPEVNETGSHQAT